MFSHFFIERPIFASVLSIVITLAGGVAVFNLPVAQYPPITPPSIMVMCNYPGANAQDVADSVAAPIEQQVNGVEDMLYMVSQSNNDGSYTLTVTFKPGVNLNFAQVLVQNRINLALPNLPDVVKQAGVTTRKRNPDILQVIAVYSPNGRYDQLYLSNFVTIKVRDEISRVDGVGDCQQFGQQDYCMRLWLDPERLSALNMSANDVANAIREQNMQVAAGHFGQEPVPNSTRFEYTISTVGRLRTPEEFDNIVLRSDSEGRQVLLKHVGRAELGAKNEDSTSKVNGKPNGSLAVFPLPDANAIAVARRVREKMEELKKTFPEDIDYVISLDMTPFMEESIHQVIRTLIEAIILVAAVVLLFLQNWRSALIPLVAVPVAVVGTFAVMAVIGFSLNNLTLFGLVLAIGIVVDDAIVVVEAVEHHIEHGLSPRRAAHTAMDQVSGPVVAVALVLSAVFVPCAFITGITGQFFRQFALTIAVSTIISAFNSLTLSPALAALLLKPLGKNTRLPVSRLGCVLVGAVLGFVLFSRLGVWGWGVGILLGTAAGWFATPMLAAQNLKNPEAFRRFRLRLVFAVVGAWLGINYLAPAIPAALQRLAHQLPPADAKDLLTWSPFIGVGGSALAVLAALIWWLAPALPGRAFPWASVRLGLIFLAAGVGTWLVIAYLPPDLPESSVAPVAPWLGWWLNGLLAGAAVGWFVIPGLLGSVFRPLREGIREPLPRIAFIFFAGWVGFSLLGPAMTPVVDWLAARQPHVQNLLAFGGKYVYKSAGALVAAPFGWFIGPALNWLLGWFFGVFNLVFQAGTSLYTRIVSMSLTACAGVLVVYGGLLGLTWLISSNLPEGYIPNQDQGRFYVAIQLPDSASLERTQKVVDQVNQLVKPMQGVLHTTGIAGQSFTFNANGSNFGQYFISFDSFDERRRVELETGLDMSANGIVARVRELLEKEIPKAKVSLFTPPPVSGLGSANGFKIIIEDRGDLGLVELQNQTDRIIAAGNTGRFKLTAASLAGLQENASALPDGMMDKLRGVKGKEYLTKESFEQGIAKLLDELGIRDKPTRDRVIALAVSKAENRKVVRNLYSVFRANTPQLYINLDRDQCQTMGVNPNDVFKTLQIYLGSFYVNDFNKFGRTWQVVAQAKGEYRDDPNKIKLLKVRNADGYMAPLGSVLSVHEKGGPINIGRYNMYQAAAILGATEPGVSSGQGIEEMEALCAEILPPGMAFEWTEINYMQIDAANNIWNNLIFPLAVVFVFLVLAAQYESWALPLAVILVVPMCILGSLTGVAVTKGDINIFTQIGFVVLVGLASKNAILIVEFAKHKREDAGLSRREATLEACKLRLRPILMTSAAFILGVVPLIVGHGAGAEMRRVLGIAVFSGMLGVTLFGIFLTPVFFYVIEGLAETPLFAAERMRVVGKTLLILVGILTLGLPWLLVFFLGRRLRTARLVSEGVAEGVVAVNGAAKHATVNGAAETVVAARLDDTKEARPVVGNGHADGNGKDEGHREVVEPVGETRKPL